MVRILDIEGRVVSTLSGVDNQYLFNGDNLPGGNYIVNVIMGQQAVNRRVTVLK